MGKIIYKNIGISDEVEFGIIKHYINSSDYLNVYVGNLIIIENNNIKIYNSKIYKKLMNYIKSIKIKTKLIKEHNYGTKLAS